MLVFAGGDSRIEIPTAPTKNPKSETMTPTVDDAELLKHLRGLGKPPLFDGNDTVCVPSLCLKTIRSFCVTWVTWWIRVQTSVTDTAIGEIANPRNQHIEMPQIQYTDKVADNHRDQGHPSISGMTNQVETQTRTSKAKLSPNIAGQKGRMR